MATSTISLSVNMEANGYTKEETEPGGSTAARGSNPRLGGCKTCNEISLQKHGVQETNESVS